MDTSGLSPDIIARDQPTISHVNVYIFRAKHEFSAGIMEGEFSLKSYFGRHCPELYQLHGECGVCKSKNSDVRPTMLI